MIGLGKADAERLPGGGFAGPPEGHGLDERRNPGGLAVDRDRGALGRGEDVHFLLGGEGFEGDGDFLEFAPGFVGDRLAFVAGLFDDKLVGCGAPFEIDRGGGGEALAGFGYHRGTGRGDIDPERNSAADRADSHGQ